MCFANRQEQCTLLPYYPTLTTRNTTPSPRARVPIPQVPLLTTVGLVVARAVYSYHTVYIISGFTEKMNEMGVAGFCSFLRLIANSPSMQRFQAIFLLADAHQKAEMRALRTFLSPILAAHNLALFDSFLCRCPLHRRVRLMCHRAIVYSWRSLLSFSWIVLAPHFVPLVIRRVALQHATRFARSASAVTRRSHATSR